MNDRHRNCCGTCLYNQIDSDTGEYVCTNSESDAYGCETSYTEKCSEYEQTY